MTMDEQPPIDGAAPPVDPTMTKAEQDAKAGLQNAANDLGGAMARLMQINPVFNPLESMSTMKLISAQLDALAEVLLNAGVITRMNFWDTCSQNIRNMTKDVQSAIGQVSLIQRPPGPLPKSPKSN